MFRGRINYLLRSYPSLNLRIDVHKDQHKALALLPGLRYDDISYTGQPDLHRLMNIISRVEHAAIYDHKLSFLDYQRLVRQGIGTYNKGMTMEIRRHFYETTTPKSPIQVSLRLTGLMDSTFIVRNSATFGGYQQASIMLKSCNSLIHQESGLNEQIPDWWKLKFYHLLPETPDYYRPIQPPDFIRKTFTYHVVVTLRDTDTGGRTQHQSYIRYFLDNISIAANSNFYPNLANMLHNYYAKRVSVVHISPSVLGDSLTVETFQDPVDELKLHCFISKDGAIKWYGCLEYYKVLFEPELETPAFLRNFPTQPKK